MTRRAANPPRGAARVSSSPARAPSPPVEPRLLSPHPVPTPAPLPSPMSPPRPELPHRFEGSGSLPPLSPCEMPGNGADAGAEGDGPVDGTGDHGAGVLPGQLQPAHQGVGVVRGRRGSRLDLDGVSLPLRSMTRSTSSPPAERQKWRAGSSPDCRNSLIHSPITAVSTSAPAEGELRAAAGSCNASRKVTSPTSAKTSRGLFTRRFPKLRWCGRRRCATWLASSTEIQRRTVGAETPTSRARSARFSSRPLRAAARERKRENVPRSPTCSRSRTSRSRYVWT